MNVSTTTGSDCDDSRSSMIVGSVVDIVGTSLRVVDDIELPVGESRVILDLERVLFSTFEVVVWTLEVRDRASYVVEIADAEHFLILKTVVELVENDENRSRDDGVHEPTDHGQHHSQESRRC